MRCLFVCLISVSWLYGCTNSQIMNDIINNQFDDKQIYADATAGYVGEWISDAEASANPLKITKDGRILMCVLKKKAENVDGKVYIEHGDTTFIFAGGTRYKVVSVDNNLMILDYYGKEHKYYAGIVPDKCVVAFKNFE